MLRALILAYSWTKLWNIMKTPESLLYPDDPEVNWELKLTADVQHLKGLALSL